MKITPHLFKKNHKPKNSSSHFWEHKNIYMVKSDGVCGWMVPHQQNFENAQKFLIELLNVRSRVKIALLPE